MVVTAIIGSGLRKKARAGFFESDGFLTQVFLTQIALLLKSLRIHGCTDEKMEYIGFSIDDVLSKTAHLQRAA